MNPEEYARMRACEDDMWWYRGLHRFLSALIPPPSREGPLPRALDIGCGTGGWLENLTRLGYRVTGIDMAYQACVFCCQRGLSRVVVADGNRLPFAAESFDLVTCIDVLECEAVSPPALVAEAIRVLKPGGRGLFQMSAHQWLASEHDLAVHAARRYNLRQMRALFRPHPVEVLRATYLFALLFPLMATWKLLRRPRRELPREEARSDVSMPPAPLNRLLYALCCLEARWLAVRDLPLGTSACILVRKHPQGSRAVR